MIAAVWISIALFLENEHSSAEKAAIQNSINLAGAFEKHLSQSLLEIDRSLKVVRARYVQNSDDFDLIRWLKAFQIFSDEVLQVTIIDRNGHIKLNSVDAKTFTGVDLSDRDHFRFHVNSHSDVLYTSKPVIGRLTGKWSIQLTRRIENDDGSFGGVIVASLDPVYLTRIYNAVNTGVDGHVRVVGVDGIVRATSGRAPSVVGIDLSGADLFKHYPSQTSGWYYTASNFSDRIPRLITFKAVENFPLIVTVGLSTRELFSRFEAERRIGYLIGMALTALIMAATFFRIKGQLLRDKTAKSMERSNMLLNVALANMPHGVCTFGADKKLLIANDLYSTMYGLNSEQANPGTSLLEILKARIAAGSSPKDTEKYIEDRLKEAFLPEPGCIVNELQDGRIFSISRRSIPNGGSVAVHQDITAQRRAEEKISHAAHYDALTNLANRVLFLDHLKKAANECRLHGKAFAVHLLDLDRFKEVNDTLGHAVGDLLLFEVASRLRGIVGADDIVARLGGDEFTVLQAISGAHSGEAALLAGKILQVIAAPFEIDGHHLMVETSIGIVLSSDQGLEATELLKKADLALYRAKADGRNDWRLFEPEMEREARARLALAMDLRNAVALKEFELHYQTVVSIGNEKVVGAEALVRWRNSRGELINPVDFIPLAEDTGLIIPLGEWVLRHACADAAGWRAPLKLAVNLSPVQFRDGNLMNVIKSALSESGLAANRLELEVTESVLLQNNDENLNVLHQLQALGISIVLDDFGTGYSSMSYLLSFPFNKIKIDRKFVAELTHRNDCMAIVSAVSALARSLDIETTAEGVESAEQLTILRAAGCTLAQGFLFGQPCPNSVLDWGAAAKSWQRATAC